MTVNQNQERNILKLAGVAGWPVHHSLSPLLHNYWLRQSAIRGGYTMFAVHPDEAIYAFQSLKKTTISGLNVTIPLKGLAFEAADEVSPDAMKLGVCNVLYKKHDKLIGHNTDMEGFAGPLLEHVGHDFILNNAVVIIGAGGAARAVLGSLLALGAPEIRLLNRTDARAKKLVSTVNIPSLYACNWAGRQEAIVGAGLLINASAAGMSGHNGLDLNLEHMSADGWVYDLVYTPLNTPLLKQAKVQGLRTIGGLDMLIAQARPSFKLFYGLDAPSDDNIKTILLNHLNAQK